MAEAQQIINQVTEKYFNDAEMKSRNVRQLLQREAVVSIANGSRNLAPGSHRLLESAAVTD